MSYTALGYPPKQRERASSVPTFHDRNDNKKNNNSLHKTSKKITTGTVSIHYPSKFRNTMNYPSIKSTSSNTTNNNSSANIHNTAAVTPSSCKSPSSRPLLSPSLSTSLQLSPLLSPPPPPPPRKFNFSNKNSSFSSNSTRASHSSNYQHSSTYSSKSLGITNLPLPVAPLSPPTLSPSLFSATINAPKKVKSYHNSSHHHRQTSSNSFSTTLSAPVPTTDSSSINTPSPSKVAPKKMFTSTEKVSSVSADFSKSCNNYSKHKHVTSTGTGGEVISKLNEIQQQQQKQKQQQKPIQSLNRNIFLSNTNATGKQASTNAKISTQHPFIKSSINTVGMNKQFSKNTKTTNLSTSATTENVNTGITSSSSTNNHNNNQNDEEFAYSKLHSMWSQRDKQQTEMNSKTPTATTPMQLRITKSPSVAFPVQNTNTGGGITTASRSHYHNNISNISQLKQNNALQHNQQTQNYHQQLTKNHGSLENNSVTNSKSDDKNKVIRSSHSYDLNEWKKAPLQLLSKPPPQQQQELQPSKVLPNLSKPSNLFSPSQTTSKAPSSPPPAASTETTSLTMNHDNSYDEETTTLLFNTNANILPLDKKDDNGKQGSGYRSMNLNGCKVEELSQLLKQAQTQQEQRNETSFVSTDSELVPRRLIDDDGQEIEKVMSSNTSSNTENEVHQQTNQHLNEVVDMVITHKSKVSSKIKNRNKVFQKLLEKRRNTESLKSKASPTFDPFDDSGKNYNNSELDDTASWKELSFDSIGKDTIDTEESTNVVSDKHEANLDDINEVTQVADPMDEINYRLQSQKTGKDLVPNKKSKNNTQANSPFIVKEDVDYPWLEAQRRAKELEALNKKSSVLEASPSFTKKSLSNDRSKSQVKEKESLPSDKSRNDTTVNTTFTFDPFDNSMLSNDDNCNLNVTDESWREASFESIDTNNNENDNMIPEIAIEAVEAENYYECKSEITSISDSCYSVNLLASRHSDFAQQFNQDNLNTNLSPQIFDPYENFDSMSTANSELTQKHENKKLDKLFSRCIEKVEKQYESIESFVGERSGGEILKVVACDDNDDDTFSDIADSAFGISNAVKEARLGNPLFNLRAFAMQQNALFNSSGASGKKCYYSGETIDKDVDVDGYNDDDAVVNNDPSVFKFSASLDAMRPIYPKAMSDSGTDVFDGLSSVAGPTAVYSSAFATKLFTEALPKNSDSNSSSLRVPSLNREISTEKHVQKKVNGENDEMKISINETEGEANDDENREIFTYLFDEKLADTDQNNDTTRINQTSQLKVHEVEKDRGNEKKRFGKYLSKFAARAKYWRGSKSSPGEQNKDKTEDNEEETIGGIGILRPPISDEPSISSDDSPVKTTDKKKAQISSLPPKSPISPPKKENHIIQNHELDELDATMADIERNMSTTVDSRANVGWIPSIIRLYEKRSESELITDATSPRSIIDPITPNPTISECRLSRIQFIQLDCNHIFGSPIEDPSILIIHKSMNDRQDAYKSLRRKLRKYLESNSGSKMGMFEKAMATHERVLTVMVVRFCLLIFEYSCYCYYLVSSFSFRISWFHISSSLYQRINNSILLWSCMSISFNFMEI